MTNIEINQPLLQKRVSIKEFFGDILGRIWAFWGLLTFIATFLIIFLPSMVSYLIPGPKGQNFFIVVSKIWMWTWLRLIGCPVKIKGLENFIKGKNYVVTFNHNALLDIPLSAPFIPGGNKTIAKTSFAKVPIFGWFYKRGSILVDRDNNRSRLKSFEDMKMVLRQGLHMCIYPEGTRNRTNQPIKQFFDGAFKLAIDTGKDVVPCLIFGTKAAMPVHKTFYLKPTKLQMHFLPAVTPDGMKAPAFKEKVFKIMLDYYEKGI